MSVKLTIPVPNIDDVIQNFDRIRVYKSITGASGPYAEVTATSSQAARLVGTNVGPFIIEGKTFELRVNRGVIQSTQIPGSNPVSAAQVAGHFNAVFGGIVASDDTGKIRVETLGVGTDEILEIVGALDTAEILGFEIGQFDVGESDRILLVAGVTEYLFEDASGTAGDWYQVEFFDSVSSEASLRSDPVKGSVAHVVPKQQADTAAPRGLTILRKTSYVFRQSFFDDAAQTTPLVPVDAGKYPSYQVVDINGQIYQSGLATLDGISGNYRVEFFVPADAPISNDDRRWRIEWLFVDEDSRQLERFTEFDVRDPDVTASEVRDQKLVAMCDKPLRVYIRERKRPFRLRLDVENANQPSCVLVDGAVFPGSGASGELLITEAQDNETFVYYFEIPENLLRARNTYRSTWTIEESIASTPNYAFQIIEVPPSIVLQFFPSLRMVIDKYQKRSEIVQSYQDSDILEYLTRGLEFVNAWHPLTGWSVETLPSPIIPYWLLAGQLWGLNAQHLLETDLQFSFGGQTTTLDYDHTGNIDTAIGRAMEWIQQGLTPAKTPLLRRSSSSGVFAGKPMRITGLHQYTYPISRVSSQDYLSLLSNLGIL